MTCSSLNKDSCQTEPRETGHGYADKAGNHEGMVEVPFPDLRGSGSVNVHGGNIRRIVGNEEVGIGGRHETDYRMSREPDGHSHRQQDFSGGSLRVHHHGYGKKRKGEGPWILIDHVGDGRPEGRHDIGKIGIGHPRNTENGDTGRHAGFEHYTVGHLRHRGFGSNHDNGAECQHHHLNDHSHGNWLCRFTNGSYGR